jgi:hypothetical protein
MASSAQRGPLRRRAIPSNNDMTILLPQMIDERRVAERRLDENDDA